MSKNKDCTKNNQNCCYCGLEVKNINFDGFVRGRYMSWSDTYSECYHVMHWNCYQAAKKSNIRCQRCNLSLTTYEKIDYSNPKNIYKLTDFERNLIYGS